MQIVIKLSNCASKLAIMGITVDPNGSEWQSLLSSKLATYLPVDSWAYDSGSDTLTLNVPTNITIPYNLTDFGDASGVSLNDNPMG